jgi:glutamate dehydrogenase/leucine dehydrogenase
MTMNQVIKDSIDSNTSLRTAAYSTAIKRIYEIYQGSGITL